MHERTGRKDDFLLSTYLQHVADRWMGQFVLAARSSDDKRKLWESCISV